MVKTLFLLSGENPDLSFAELRHILEFTGGFKEPALVEKRIAVADLPINLHEYIVLRAAYTKLSATLLGLGEVSELLSGSVMLYPGWENLVPAVNSFCVEVYGIAGIPFSSTELEKKIAENILGSDIGLRVDLDNPDVKIVCIASPKTYAVGVLTALKPKKYFTERRAGLKPFKTPSALQPKVARCLVNLAVQSLDSRVLDPFAGSGAVVVEAGLMGHEAVGVELKTWICEGMRRNTSYYCPGTYHTVQGDALTPPFTKSFDAVATDPPYGRSTTLSGRGFEKLLQDFFKNITAILKPRARMVLTIPRETFEALQTCLESFKVREYYDLYVHKSLTRRLVVLTYV
jgi:tRNA (guanine10-N2)-dimethyltransferase